MNKLIDVINLSKRFDKLIIFDNVNFSIYENGLYCLVGESGSGKSTLLHILNNLDRDYNGKVIFNNVLKSDNNFSIKDVAILEQNPSFFVEMTVYENLTLICEDDYKINEILIKLFLKNKRNICVKNLSGGEKMRLALARCLLISPRLILCDEPTGSLNDTLSIELMNLLKEEAKDKAVFIVSHDETLMDKYVDVKFRLQNKKIILLKNNLKDISISKFEEKKILNKIKYSFIIKYIFTKFKAKKVQSILCIISLFISLFTIGFSSLLKEEVSNSVKESFKTLIDENQIYVKNKDEIIKNEFNTISINEAEDIVSNSSFFDDFNYLYYGDFENQFKDANYMALIDKENVTPFYEVGLRNITESILLDDIKNNFLFYPSFDEKLAYDEVILGLRRQDIRKICRALNLLNEDYLTLSTYLENNTLDFVFYFQNDSWGYNNEILLRMKSFFLTDEKLIFCHNKKDFVSNIIENELKLPCSTDLKRNEYLPWTIKRATYIKTKKDSEYDALKEYFQSEFYTLYDLEKIKGNLNSSFLSSSFHKGKYIVTYAPDNKINYQDIKTIIDNDEELFPLDEAYPLIKEAMVSGFKNSIFFASLDSDLDYVENYYTSLNQNADTLDLSSVNYNANISYGNLITAMKNKGVKLKTKKPKLKKGRFPFSENEIVISSSLAKKLFKDNNPINKRIYLLFNNYDDIYNNSFKRDSLLIVGIFEEEREFIYQEAYWYYIYICLKFDYPLESINFNSFIYSSNKDIEYLNKTYIDYTFENPLYELCESVNTFMDMLNIILYFFIILLFISSFAILFLTLNNLMFDAEKEIGLLKSLSFKKKEIAKMYLYYSFSFSIVSISLATFVIYIINCFLKYFIFHIKTFYLIYYEPILEIIIFGILLSLIPCILNVFIPLNKDTNKLLKKYN